MQNYPVGLSPYASRDNVSTSLFSSPFSSAATRPSSALPDYKARARALLGSTSTRVKATVSALSQGDSLGAMVAQGAIPTAIAIGAGGVDHSPLGKSFSGMVNDVADPSTVSFFAALGVRAMGLDKKHPRFRYAVSSTLKGLAPVLGYKLGRNIVRSSLFTGGAGASKIAGAKVAGVMGEGASAAAAPVASAPFVSVREPIPGEATVA